MRVLLLAVQGLRSDVVKSLLTVVALTLGMLGLVSVVAAESVLSQSVTQRALAQGGDAATFSVSLVGVRTPGDLLRLQRQLRAITGADAASTVIDDADVALAGSDGHALDTTVRFVGDDLWTVRRGRVTSGSWISSRPLTPLTVPVALNAAAAGEAAGASGLRLQTQGVFVRAVVVGIVDDGETSARVYAPTADAARFAPADSRTSAVLLSGGALTQEAVTGAVKRLSGLGVPVELGDAARTDTVRELAQELGTTANVLYALGALSLIAAITAVANVGLATARARSREYALRRTLGASRAQIALATIVESQLIGLLAAAVAATAAWLLFPVVLSLFSPPAGLDPPGFSVGWALLCVAVASAASLIVSLVPAVMSFARDNSAVMRE